MPSRRLAAVVTVVLVIAFAVVAVAPAFAAAPGAAPGVLPFHASLLGSTPKDGSTVDTAGEVVLEFNEDVDETFVEVTVEGPDGSEVQGEPEVDGRAVTQALSSDLPAGEHRVTYRVVSTDGHPVSGTVTFTSTVAPGQSAEPTASVTPSPSATASADPTPSTTPTVDGEPASESAGTAPWVWILVGAALVVALGGLAALATHRRGAPADGHAGTGDDDRPAGPAVRPTGATNPSPDRFRPDGGRLIISASRAISSIGRAADS